ncbi:MAG: beta-ketoacyl synthase N-terminal-like domain-containing protein, partial [Nannocystaceae bacterium]
MHRVVITGIGAWTAYGPSWEACLAGVAARQHAFSPFGKRMPERPDLHAGLVHKLAPFRPLFPQVKPPLPSALSRMLLVATKEALTSAELDPSEQRPEIGMYVNRNRGPSSIVSKVLLPVLRKGPKKMSPLKFSRTVANAPLGVATTVLGLRGPGLLTMGGGAVMVGWDAVRAGLAGPIVCAGIDEIDGHTFQAGIDNGHFAGVTTVEGYRPGTEGSCLPIPGEAAVSLVLETGASADARGVSPLARCLSVERALDPNVHARPELTGWGAATGAGLQSVCQRALDQATISASQLHLHVGGQNGAPAIDAAETAMLAGLGRSDLAQDS